MLGNLGMTELLLIFLVVLLVFGAKRIPEIARGMGKGIREFKDATREMKKEFTDDGLHPMNQVEPPRGQYQQPPVPPQPEYQQPVAPTQQATQLPRQG